MRFKKLTLIVGKFSKLSFLLSLLIMPNITKPVIQELKGLYNLFTPDVIGIGQAFLAKGWIENIYTYAPNDNLAKKVIKSFWRKNNIVETNKINEFDNFVLRSINPIDDITLSDFIKILTYIRGFKIVDKEEVNKGRELVFRSLSKKVREKKKFMLEMLEDLEALKLSEDFIPETAEAILWAVYDKKFEVEKDLDVSAKESDKKIIDNKWDKDKYKEFKIEAAKISSKELMEKITSIEGYDFSTHSMLKIAKMKIVPTKVEEGRFVYREKTEEFSTCFESTLLDMFSILLYDPKNKKYDEKMLPEEIFSRSDSVKSEIDFRNIISKVFTSDSKELIDQGNINSRIQQWIDITGNLPEIAYGESKDNVHYDLDTSFENLIKILNIFYNLGLDIKSDKNNLNNIEININGIKEIISTDIAQKFWDQLFSFVALKLSTQKRTISFNAELYDKNKKIIIDKSGKVRTEQTNGIVSVKIEYEDIDYEEFNVEFKINIDSGHAYLTCEARSGLNFDFLPLGFRNNLAAEFYKEKDNKLYPAFILLANLGTKEPVEKKEANKIKNLLYYCFDLKDINIKVKFIMAKFLNNYKNEKFYNLVENLIDLMVYDAEKVLKLIKFFHKNNSLLGVDKLLEKLIRKNIVKTSYLILSENDKVSDDLFNKIIKECCSSFDNKKKLADMFFDKIKNINFLFKNEKKFPELDEIIQQVIRKISLSAMVYNEDMLFKLINCFHENNNISGVDKLLEKLIEKYIVEISYLILSEKNNVSGDLFNKIIKECCSSVDNKKKLVDMFFDRTKNINFLFKKEKELEEIGEIIQQVIMKFSSDDLIKYFFGQIFDVKYIDSVQKYLGDTINKYFSEEENRKKFIDFMNSGSYLGDKKIDFLHVFSIINYKDVGKTFLENVYEVIVAGLSENLAYVDIYTQGKENILTLISNKSFNSDTQDIILDKILKNTRVRNVLIESLSKDGKFDEVLKILIEKSSDDLIYYFLNRGFGKSLNKCLGEKISKYLSNSENYRKYVDFFEKQELRLAKRAISIVTDQKLKSSLLLAFYKHFVSGVSEYDIYSINDNMRFIIDNKGGDKNLLDLIINEAVKDERFARRLASNMHRDGGESSEFIEKLNKKNYEYWAQDLVGI